MIHGCYLDVADRGDFAQMAWWATAPIEGRSEAVAYWNRVDTRVKVQCASREMMC